MENFTFTKTEGILIIRPISAKIVDTKLVNGKMKLFCKVRLGTGILETPADLRGGQTPQWGTTLEFSTGDEKGVRLEVYHKNRFSKHKFLGECYLPLDVMAFVAELYGKCEIRKQTAVVGSLDVQIKWIPKNGSHPSPISRASLVSHPITQYTHSTSFSSQGSPGRSQGSSSPNISPTKMAQFPATAYYMALHQSLDAVNGRQVGPSSFNLPNHISLPGLKDGECLQNVLENFSKEMKKRITQLKYEDDEKEQEDIKDDERCIVCLGKKRSGVFYRCGHSCCCTSCGVSFIGSKCPICRDLVFDFIKTFNA